MHITIIVVFKIKLDSYLKTSKLSLAEMYDDTEASP